MRTELSFPGNALQVGREGFPEVWLQRVPDTCSEAIRGVEAYTLVCAYGMLGFRIEKERTRISQGLLGKV